MNPESTSRRTRRSLTGTAALALSSFAFAPLAAAQDFIVPAGTSVFYNTSISGAINANRFVIEPGAYFVVEGSLPLKISAASVEINGNFIASGTSNEGVLGLNYTNVPEMGSDGAAGGGQGGTGSINTTSSTPAGLNGGESYGISFPGIAPGGGGGGESGYGALGFDAKERRRAAGGGGGALAANQPVASDPFASENRGLIAEPGMGGGLNGTGAISGVAPAAGGLPGLALFQDTNPNNDFWGTKLTALGSIVGEARRPLPGRGGGAGGDAVGSSTFPLNPFLASGDEKGAGGGGGGGLVLIVTRTFRLGSAGRILANGGNGGGGENVIFFDRVGGGSGAGSGGWIILEAKDFDLSNASEASITALGGRGGEGREGNFPGTPFGNFIEGAGGNGGPGVIQFHVNSGQASELSLPVGKTVADITSPTAHVLLPKLTN